jgi:hypothetical protein
MTGDPRLSPSPTPATHADLRAAQERDHLLRTELPRVREAATAWRNGLGALLVGLIGFGLVKGRSDISQIDADWATAVGLLLLAALLVGTYGALKLVRAAHGSALRRLAPVRQPARVADHLEAIAAADALRLGVCATVGCTALLVLAVGATWYGPERDSPSLRVETPAGPVCGSVVRLGGGILTLKTSAGERKVDMRAAQGLQAGGTC